MATQSSTTQEGDSSEAHSGNVPGMMTHWHLIDNMNNFSVNLNVANLLKIGHVGCKNHMLDLWVYEMVKQTQELEVSLNSIHDMMSQC